MVCLVREALTVWRKGQIALWSVHGKILSQDGRLWGSPWVSIGEIKKATSGKECGLNILISIAPLPYAGIIQVRYEGRPIWFGHLSEYAPLAL
jgi:hypothetical protein